MTRRTNKDGPHHIDVHVGQRVRERRIILGLSQEKLAALTDVTFQQVQKREKGVNRLSASSLFVTAKALGVPIGYFYEGLDNAAAIMLDPALANKGSLAIVRALQDVDPEIAHQILQLIRKISGDAEEPAKAVA